MGRRGRHRPVASLTVTKLRWLAEHEPDRAARVTRVLLPHDWLTWQLGNRNVQPTTDRGDASGTGYWSPTTGKYRVDILEHAFGRILELPRVADPREIVGERADGAVLAPGTEDNMGAALGLGAHPGDVVVSIGTSGTVFAVSETLTADATGTIAGFADATGRFLPLVCTLNAARVLAAGARMLDVDLDVFSNLALSAPSGAGGLVLLPYLDGERTPNLPEVAGTLHGMRRDNLTPACLARAVIEGDETGRLDAAWWTRTGDGRHGGRPGMVDHGDDARPLDAGWTLRRAAAVWAITARSDSNACNRLRWSAWGSSARAARGSASSSPATRLPV
jgi:xylulokinase